MSAISSNFSSFEAETAAAIRASLEPVARSQNTSSSSNGVTSVKKEEAVDVDLQASITEIEKIYQAQALERQKANKPKEERTSSSSSSSSAHVLDPELQREIEAIESAHTKMRLDKLLVPTENERWAKHKLNVVEQIAIAAFRGTALKGILTKNGKKLSDKTWKKITSTSVFDMKTLGDIEKMGITLIKESEDSDKAKLKSHNNLKKYLKIYAEKGLAATVQEASK